MKFQWSKVASVLGSYKDFLHAYTMSLDSTNFSKGQLEAQLDTITRKFEQLKATMTGIATGMGASGLSAYIKNILSSLNAFAQSLQRIPTYVWKILGGFVALAGAVGAALVVVKLLAAGIGAVTAGVTAYTAAATAGTIATEGMAAAVTAATGGLNILLGLAVAAVAAFFGYNAIVSSNIEAINNEAQALEDNVQVKRQEIEMSEKQGELIETLCNNHAKLQEAVNTTTEGTEQHKRAEEDLAATDQALTAIIGEDAMKQIDWNGDLQGSIDNLKNAHSEKTKKLRLELAQSLEAQAAYQEAEQQRIEATITNLSTEGTAWTKLGQIIESVLHTIGGAMVSMGEGLQSMGGKVKELFPSVGEWIQSSGSSIMYSGMNHLNFHSEWSDDRADNASEIAALKGQLAQSKASSAKARLEADAIRGTGGESNPYAANTGVNNDSGIVPESEGKDSGAGSKGKGAGAGKGAREADNSIEAMLYRHMTKTLKLTHAQAIGELANIQQESGFDYTADNGTHRGLYQMDSTRWAEYQNWLTRTGREDSAVSQVDYRNLYESKYVPYEAQMQQAYLQSGATTPREYAAAFNEFIERSGEVAGDIGFENRMRNADELSARFSKRNGEENFDDVLGAREDAYKRLYEQFDKEIQDLKAARAEIGQGISAEEKLKIFEKVMGLEKGKDNAIFAEVKKAQDDYAKLLLDKAKEDAKRAEATKKATDTQVAAIDKMADAEVAFAEKLGLMSKADVRDYYNRKNERNYATQKPILDAKLASTVALNRGTAEDMMAAYQGLIYAKDRAEAEWYAKKLMWLSRDVDATKKALDEEMKLEEAYQSKRQELAREAYQEDARYVIGFIDSFTNAFQSGLESMLNGTKSFGAALRDIFKSVVNDIIKMFTQDLANKVKGWLSKLLHPTGEELPLGANPSGYLGGGKKKTDTSIMGGGDFGSLILGSYGDLGLFGRTQGIGLGDKKGKGNGGNSGLFGGFSVLDNLIPKNTMQEVKQRMNQIGSTMQNTISTSWTAVNAATQQGTATMQATTSASTAAMGAEWGAYKTEQVATEQAGDAAIVAESETTAATVQATTATMMTWIMAVLALFSLFGGFGGGGSSETKKTSSVNLGRSPDSYYMTPTPVMQSTTFTVPSFDIGGNIEKDMFAMVHKNEMVLTPEQADVIRNTARNGGSLGGGNSSNANIKSNIQVSTVDSRGFERVLRNYNRDLSKNVKKGIRNGYLTARGLV